MHTISVAILNTHTHDGYVKRDQTHWYALTFLDYGYGNGNQYQTSYGGQGAADGGGFVGGDAPQSSPAGARVRLNIQIGTHSDELTGRLWQRHSQTSHNKADS